MFAHLKTSILSITLSLLTCIFPITSTHANQAEVTIKILGINDFHGQISTGRQLNNEPVGGAAVLASYLKYAQAGMEEQTLITIMGDQVGASPPASGLLNDEPTILFTNSLGNRFCNSEYRLNPQCNIVATVGNHEFDKGQKAMFDLIYGSKNPPTNNWYPLPNYPGSNYPYLSANIIDAKTQQPLFPPYTIKRVHDIPVAFIGAVLKDAASSMLPENYKDVLFLDEVQSINRYIPEIKAQGAEIIVVLIHEGGYQTPYEGATKTDTQVQGNINTIVHELDDSIDVVMSGHTHEFVNAFIPNKHGVNILVTQANSYSASFAEVTLQVDKNSHKINQKSAKIITTYANRWPGTEPDEATLKLVQLAEDKVAPYINKYVGTLETSLPRAQNDAGESSLGNLIADAYKAEMHADIALINPHGIRNDMSAGIITQGTVYTILPFSNYSVLLSLTGSDIYELLEQQWFGSYENILQISGMDYSYNLENPLGHKILNIQYNNQPLVKDKTYTIATSNFLASGSGVFSVMKKAKIIQTGIADQDLLAQYISQLPQPFAAPPDGRIKKTTH